MVPLRESRKNPHMPHTSPDQCIDDLCRQIQGERDKHKLLKLIDQLDGLLVKEKHLARMSQKRHSSEELMEQLSEDLLFCFVP